LGTTARKAIHDSVARGVVEVINPSGRGEFVLVCEHASNAIPNALSNLGLTPAVLHTHIAWDLDALEVAREMAEVLDAPLVAARACRLVYDCNRPPEAHDAIPVRSETVDIPGNAGIDDNQRRERFEQYYVPFRDALSGCLDARTDGLRRPVLLTIHSFTPVYAGVRREVQLGILHDADTRFADALLAVAEAEFSLVIRRNEPYGPRDGVTHTLATHGVRRGLLNAMIEIRNDLIVSADDRRTMAARLSRCVVKALAAVGASGDPAAATEQRH
jgi:predicted N-formylglutamate amidohydrolase